MRYRNSILCTSLVLLAVGCENQAQPAPKAAEPAEQATSSAQGLVSSERGGPTEVMVRFRDVVSGMRLDATDELQLELTDNTGEGRDVRLIVVASGLGGRLIERPLQSVSIAPGTSMRLGLRVDELPLQSAELASFVSIEVELVRDDGEAVRVTTPPLYYVFDEGYTAATFYDEAEVAHAPELLAGPKDPMRFTGLVRNEDGSFVEVVGSEDGIQGATVVRAMDPDDFEIPVEPPPSTATTIPNIPGGGEASAVTQALVNTTRVCGTWRVQYVDSGFGEDVMPGSQWQDVAASYAAYTISRIVNGSTAALFGGNLDVGGCADVALPAAGTYSLHMTTNYTHAGSVTFATTYNDNGFLTMHSVDTYFGYAGTPGSTLTVRSTYSADDVQGGAVTGAILAGHAIGLISGQGGLGLIAGTYNMIAHQDCGGNVKPPTDSCYKPSTKTVHLGTTVINGTAESHWKFIIAHELGHHIQDVAMGHASSSYSDTAQERLCKCDHYDTSWSNQMHCLQSREITGGAQLEGFAQAFASRVFNQNGETGARFVYYKPFLYSNLVVGYPPLASFPDGYSRWMETNCTSADRGTELDWMQFFYHVSAEYSASFTKLSDLFAIYRRACTGTATGMCNDHTVSWTKLLDAAKAHYGGSATNAKYLRFRDAGISSGVDN
jgi:hypothetical protein